MTKRLAAVLFLSLVASACEATPPAKEVAAIPACAGSRPDCDSGLALCAADNGGTCLMCRCSAYQPPRLDLPLAGTLPGTNLVSGW